jgi:hypothetical protein
VAGAGWVTTIVPVLTVQPGCSLTLATGWDGIDGCALMFIVVREEVQSSEVLFAIKV